MNDTPSYSAAWDRTHALLATADERRSQELLVECGLHLTREARAEKEGADRRTAIRKGAAVREQTRQGKHNLTLRNIPKWPAWAIPLSKWVHGACAACHKPLHERNVTGICWKCCGRAGRDSPRLRLALAAHLGRQL